ncbi:MAG: nitrate/nitrite transporter NrtS [Alphaproteobacteria bacterium]|jgi:hypothetical protein|nr:nitrate/nitrite transporter NrtS [Alphaproteobacteria bacterium]MBT4019580.1 nitrate/nitrite transporter NrtS [Alphaproteobacteria bacterium]MBT5160805.1 nitrate/nitrite transporter NrtS [Alphaproteobacteria bacterium]MBT5919934.1 nitrate/nitrite transporter NrtS [Alphaproteobacteria bacterium]MBT6386735.1 nitrate/nitrite transporter NrtS [Alphaproteobacteria bacterium]
MSGKLLTAYRRRKTLVRGCKVSVVVGSLLLLINQGPDIYEGTWPAWWQIILTYIVPFLVSTLSAAMAEAHHAKLPRDD